MKGRKRQKIKFIILLLLVLLSAMFSLILYAIFAFQPMPKVVSVRQIYTDRFGQVFWLSQDNQLYISGWNRDRFGFYDTSFRWGKMYGLRFLLGKKEPVLFTEHVSDVFKCEDGVLYTDLDGKLYYYGEQTGGKTEAIAGNVKTASHSSFGVAYISSDSSAHFMIWDYGASTWAEPIILMENAQDINVDEECLRLLTKDGQIWQWDLLGNKNPTKQDAAIIADNVEAMWTGRDITVIQKVDGVYQVLSRENNNTPREIKNLNANSKNLDEIILDMDLKDPYPGSYYLTAQGNIYILEGEASTLVASLPENNIVDFSVNYEELYIMSRDGTYQSIPCQSGQSGDGSLIDR